VKVGLSWLQEYVDVDLPAEKLAELFDLSGTKVESLRRPAAGVNGVVVAEVLDIQDHPNADNLILVEVKADGDEVNQVVCGVRNFQVGDRVPYARVGSKLPDLEISERKIRGVSSAGMLCSPAELGVSQDHSGILVLPPESQPGQDVKSLLGLDEVIFEFEITPNRPDCMNVIGLAREVSVLLRTELRIPDIDTTVGDDLDASVEVRVDDRTGCPRYLARYLEGIKIAPSPGWMSSRLLAAGVRPISNVVDATNFVMLEFGQPLHAFDADLLHKRTIVVRRAKKGERITTLDGVERDLHPDDLMIADPKHSVGIAGVMGGEDSEVSDATERVILESAYFNPSSIAFTARRHQLRTEASARFERGADPEIVPVAAARAAQLMVETAGGRLSAVAVDEYPAPVERPTVTLKPQRADVVLGAPVAPETQAEYLRRLGMEVTEQEDFFEVLPPSFRPDIRREEDLIEEVGRLAGFDRLPSTLPPGRAGALDARQEFERRVRRIMSARGIAEAWTNSLMGPRDLDRLGLPSDHTARRVVSLANPLSEDEPWMRTTLLPGLLGAAERNVAHRATSVALFELARVYEPSGGDLPTEAMMLSGVFLGPQRPQHWNSAEIAWDFFAVKGVIDSLCSGLGVGAVKYTPLEGFPFHPTRAASISLDAAQFGLLGELHPEVCEHFGVPERAVGFELALAPLAARLPEREQIEELPRYPGVYLDLAVVVDDSTPAENVESTIREAGAPELTSVRLFDLYRGEQIPAGKKSLAYALTFRVPDRTLTDEDAAAIRDRIVAALTDRTGATIRA
jgi:phenylalanyl-tRNA synthetase beta chain